MKKPIINTLPYDIHVVTNNEVLSIKEFVSREVLNELIKKLKPPRYYVSMSIPKASQPVNKLEPGFIYIVNEEQLAQIKQNIQPGITLGIQLWLPDIPIVNNRCCLRYESFTSIWI